MMEGRLLKPIDIPLIITSTNSSPEITRRNLLPETSDSSRKHSFDQRNLNDEKNLTIDTIDKRRKSSTTTTATTIDRVKNRNVIGGSLKIDIGRNNSATNLIQLPAKWSSVRIKGTGFKDSRKSVVKIEPCNGIPNVGLPKKDYETLLSPTQQQQQALLKQHLGNVSLIKIHLQVCQQLIN